MLCSMMLSPSTTTIFSPVHEVLGETQRVGDAPFALLVGVADVLQAEVGAVAEQLQEVPGEVTARDDLDVGRCPR